MTFAEALDMLKGGRQVRRGKHGSPLVLTSAPFPVLIREAWHHDAMVPVAAGNRTDVRHFAVHDVVATDWEIAP
jgi:hypothetical protein